MLNITLYGGFSIKKFKFDKQYVKISIYALCTIILALIFRSTLENFDLIGNFFKTVLGILTPFFSGFFIAYLLNPLIRFLEKKVFVRIKILDNRDRIKRALSLLTAYIFTFTLIIWFIPYILIEILNNIMALVRVSPTYINSILNSLQSFFEEYPDIFSGNIEQYINSIFDIILAKVYELPTMLSSTVTYLVSGTMTFASKLLDLILAIIISIYVLADKEKFARQSKKIIYTLLDKNIADKIMGVINDSNKVFESFLIGKIIDSSIIGVICFVGLYFLKIPYTLLISIIIAITNMIPYFGPFIGAVPAIFITIIAASPLSALWVGIFILALQQFDGNILGPKILGDSTGLSPFWIIFSITVGGALGGVLGMFIGVPIFAVIYTMFSAFINRKHDEKVKLNSNIRDDKL